MVHQKGAKGKKNRTGVQMHWGESATHIRKQYGPSFFLFYICVEKIHLWTLSATLFFARITCTILYSALHVMRTHLCRSSAIVKDSSCFFFVYSSLSLFCIVVDCCSLVECCNCLETALLWSFRCVLLWVVKFRRVFNLHSSCLTNFLGWKKSRWIIVDKDCFHIL